ncbi:hypothetical protein FACS1894152_0200 [Bacilli bacterium]|nr:hypothetical protein FACS1894152_0200 [Bacilli bacterium]
MTVMTIDPIWNQITILQYSNFSFVLHHWNSHSNHTILSFSENTILRGLKEFKESTEATIRNIGIDSAIQN